MRFGLRHALQHVLFGNLGYVCRPSEGPSPSGLYRSPSVTRVSERERERERERRRDRESVFNTEGVG